MFLFVFSDILTYVRTLCRNRLPSGSGFGVPEGEGSGSGSSRGASPDLSIVNVSSVLPLLAKNLPVSVLPSFVIATSR